MDKNGYLVNKKILCYLCSGIFVVLISCNSKTVDPLGQFDSDVAAIDSYLTSNNIKAYKDARGIRFTIEKIGTGLPARADQNIKVDYVGRLLSSGNIFDQSLAIGPLTNYIPGWQIGIPLFPKGTKATLYIPSSYGYGTAGSSGIPPNSNLVFKVDILDVVVTQQEKDQLTGDVQKIDDYLKASSITATKDTTGIRYVITKVGTGANPSWYIPVKFSYSGRLLNTGVQFATGISLPTSGFDSRVVDYITGFQIGLQKMNLGAKATFYIPSSLAFGAKASDAVPTNSNLIYELEVLEIIP